MPVHRNRFFGGVLLKILSGYLILLLMLSGCATNLEGEQASPDPEASSTTDAVDNSSKPELLVGDGDPCEPSSPMAVGLVGTDRVVFSCGPDGAYHPQMREDQSLVLENDPDSPFFSPGEMQTLALDRVESIPYAIDPDFIEGGPCAGQDQWVVGRLRDGQYGLISCDQRSLTYGHQEGLPLFDLATMKPLLPASNGKTGADWTYPYAYIWPANDGSNPKSEISFQNGSVEPCRLPELEQKHETGVGFPVRDKFVDITKPVNIFILAISFPDIVPSKTPAKDHQDILEGLQKFWDRQSTNGVTFNYTIPDDYRMMPDTAASYDMGDTYQERMKNGNLDYYAAQERRLADDAYALYDDDYDFSEIDWVIMMWPREGTNEQFASFSPNTYMADFDIPPVIDGKSMQHLTVPGDDEQRDPFNWIHESGHHLGLTDFGFEGPTDQTGVEHRGYYDIMTSYRNMELFAWHRFLLGILNDDQIDCKTDSTTTTHLIRPVSDKTTETKAVVIPTGKPGVALVLESRKRQGYDVLLGELGEGLIAYEVNTANTIHWGGNSAIQMISPKRPEVADIRFAQAFQVGEGFCHAGIRVDVLEAGSFGEVVSVTKDGC